MGNYQSLLLMCKSFGGTNDNWPQDNCCPAVQDHSRARPQPLPFPLSTVGYPSAGPSMAVHGAKSLLTLTR